jgi:hypothetical protein
MNEENKKFEDILEDVLRELDKGKIAPEVLSMFPEYQKEIGEVLKIIDFIKDSEMPKPNESSLRSAIKSAGVTKELDPRLLISQKGQKSPFAYLLVSFKRNMAIALIIALILGGGTSFAAESALPGDALYPIKISVNEEVRGWVAFTDQAEANLEANLAKKRLEEAESLSAEGRLDTKTQVELKAKFEDHAKRFEERASKLQDKNDGKTSLEVYSNFEANLKAHADILARMESNTTAVNSILGAVRLKINSSSEAKATTSAEVSANQSSAEGKMKAAENKITEVKNFIARKDTEVSASVKAEAEARIKLSETTFARGKTELEAKEYAKAFISFQEAMMLAQEAKIIVAASQNIEIRMKNPDLKLNLKLGEENRKNDKDDDKEDSKSDSDDDSNENSTSTSENANINSDVKIRVDESETKIKTESKLRLNLGL